MRQLLQFSCGLSQTPFGRVDFTGRWYPEEPLSVFRPSLTLAIDDQGRRWIAEVGNRRGLPGPVWCVLPKPEVAMFIDRNLADSVVGLHSNQRRDGMLQWLTVLNIRARKIWASRHANGRHTANQRAGAFALGHGGVDVRSELMAPVPLEGR
jgi:hypothetical protein